MRAAGPEGPTPPPGTEDPLERDVELPGGVRFRIREWPGPGPSLLLIHGFLGSRRSWGELPSRLGPVHTVAVDLPGHGASGGARSADEVSVPGVAGLLAELQDRVFPGPAAWLGYSMGGRIALAAAAEGVAMSRLLVESAGPGLATEAAREERREADRRRADALRAGGMDAFVDQWLRMPLFRGLADLPADVRAAARAVRLEQDPDRMAAWLLGAGTGSQPDYRGALSGLRLPVHLVAGEKDAKYAGLAREMAEWIPRCSLRIVPDAGHVVHLEAPGAWLDWVGDSLAS